MSDSERDITPDSPATGDVATHTPPGGTAPHDDAYAHHAFGGDEVVPEPQPEPHDEGPEVPRRRVRVRKLRVFGVVTGLSLLAAVSAVFGMMMAVTSDLPSLEQQAHANSKLYDRNGVELGLLTGNEKRIFLQSDEISPYMKHAIVAIEDRRFWTNDGVDVRGIGRALYQDVIARKVVQGGSTITQQFVKNALAAQDDRTLFRKLQEATLAWQITRKWSKERILRNYLNTIYFGNGAYGIESAARTYFGTNHPGCGEADQPKCAELLAPEEAAMIAGLVASPNGYDPIGANRPAAAERRALVLQRMVEQDYLNQEQHDAALLTSLPTSRDIIPPAEDTKYPYFTSWVKQQVVDKLGGGQTGVRKAFEGGLRVETTLDSRLQDAAEASVKQWLPDPLGPRASLVAIKNDTGEVLAMVGGDDYASRPFNLATQGRRQPGSAFKPFVLAQALDSGISPESTWTSAKMAHCVTRKRGKCLEYFEVNNYEDAYGGVRTLRSATTFSDNAVYAQVGIEVGPRKIARLAQRMGIRTPVSSNLAMTLGGLREGVTPLDMAHAYETFADEGRLTYGTMSPGAVERTDIEPPVPGPVGIREISHLTDDKHKPIVLPNGEPAVNKVREWPVVKSSVAGDVASILSSVISHGTAARAQLPGEFVAGKTGTTENYGDAWFVGWTDEITVAVWVGYPDELRPMETEFAGEPVAGGTYPAEIWRTFVAQAIALEDYGGDPDDESPELPGPEAPPTPGTEPTVAPTAAGPDEDDAPTGDGPEQAPEGDPDAGTGPAPEPEVPDNAAPPAQQPATEGGGTAPQ